jgi:hypothetical protein
MSESEQHETVDPDELEDQETEELPGREAMSTLDLPGGGLGPPHFEDPPPT